MFFAGNDGTVAGRELWMATTSGVQLAHDISPQGSSDPEDLVANGGRIFFTASTPTTGRELWTSSGRAPDSPAPRR